MKITELFDAPVPGQSTPGEEHHRLNFNIDGREYNAIIDMFDNGCWEVSFTIKDGEIWTDKAIGTGGEIKVFSTVVNFVVQFLNNNLDKVETLVFTSDQESRTKLYARMAKLCAAKFNLTIETEESYDVIQFMLTNPAYKEAG